MSTGENQGGGDWRPPDPGQGSPGGSSTPPPPAPQGGQWGTPPASGQWGAPGGQPQWQAPYGGHPGGQPPPNYLVWSILTTLLCCLPFGVVSIVFSTQVGSKHAQGDYAGAEAASRKAKTWAIASAVSGIVLTIILVGFGLLGALVPTSQNAGF